MHAIPMKLTEYVSRYCVSHEWKKLNLKRVRPNR